MNLTKLIKGLQKEIEPLFKERDKIQDKINDLDWKFQKVDDAIKALQNAEFKLEEIKNKEDDY